MGIVETIDHDRWPKQYDNVGRRCQVTFRYDTDLLLPGRVVRDDAEAPWQTIIQLDDGRVLRAEECQYHVLPAGGGDTGER